VRAFVLAPPPIDRRLDGWSFIAARAGEGGVRHPRQRFQQAHMAKRLPANYSNGNSINPCKLIWIIFWAGEVYLLRIANGAIAPSDRAEPKTR
jgi:hypothetical protein